MCVFESIYVCMFVWMYVLSYKRCRPGHCHNSFMATGALGHTHLRLDVVGFQDSRKAQVNTTATNIIIDRNIYISLYLYLYLSIYLSIYNMLEKNKHCR